MGTVGRRAQTATASRLEPSGQLLEQLAKHRQAVVRTVTRVRRTGPGDLGRVEEDVQEAFCRIADLERRRPGFLAGLPTEKRLGYWFVAAQRCGIDEGRRAGRERRAVEELTIGDLVSIDVSNFECWVELGLLGLTPLEAAVVMGRYANPEENLERLVARLWPRLRVTAHQAFLIERGVRRRHPGLAAALPQVDTEEAWGHWVTFLRKRGIAREDDLTLLAGWRAGVPYVRLAAALGTTAATLRKRVERLRARNPWLDDA